MEKLTAVNFLEFGRIGLHESILFYFAGYFAKLNLDPGSVPSAGSRFGQANSFLPFRRCKVPLRNSRVIAAPKRNVV
ncbi:hypothetical protein ACVIW2_000200 [Bradyrhizobium huanghuaihaiense]